VGSLRSLKKKEKKENSREKLSPSGITVHFNGETVTFRESDRVRDGHFYRDGYIYKEK
jgi:hypothetical protein